MFFSYFLIKLFRVDLREKKVYHLLLNALFQSSSAFFRYELLNSGKIII